MSKLSLTLQSAEANRLCMDWGCTTCGAQDFRKLICRHLGHDNLFTPSAARQLVQDINELPTIESKDGLIFLLRVCARFIEAETLLNMLINSAAKSLYVEMLEAKAYADKRRLDHALRNDPAFIEQARAEKKASKAQAHQERLKAKAIRETEWKQKNPK